MAVRLRSLLVPAEHGAWSFVLEPIVLGLLVAPSRSGGALALAAIAVFLARQPLKLALADRASGHTYPRTVVAFQLAAGVSALAALVGVMAWNWTTHRWWPPVVAALPLGLLQLSYDVRREGRQFVPELAGPIAASASAPAIAAAAGWRPAVWLTLWALVAAHGLAATLYVRARLSLERGDPVLVPLPVTAHVAALGLSLALAAAGLAPRLAVLAFALLLVRAAWGLSSRRRPARAQGVGLAEVVTSAVFVAMVAAAYYAAGGRP